MSATSHAPRPAPPAACDCGSNGDLEIRSLRPADGGLVERVFAGLGPDSRYWRFHGPKPRLSARERDYLSAVDGNRHVALVALDGAGEPLGIARYVRLADDPGAAEIAVEVIDACQRRGIGAALIRGLGVRAAEAGLRLLTASVLAGAPIATALAPHGWRLAGRDGAQLTFARAPASGHLLYAARGGNRPRPARPAARSAAAAAHR